MCVSLCESVDTQVCVSIQCVCAHVCVSVWKQCVRVCVYSIIQWQDRAMLEQHRENGAWSEAHTYLFINRLSKALGLVFNIRTHKERAYSC